MAIHWTHQKIEDEIAAMYQQLKTPPTPIARLMGGMPNQMPTQMPRLRMPGMPPSGNGRKT